MRRIFSAAAIAGVLSTSFCLAQSSNEQTGAKAIFMNSLTNEQSMAKTNEKPSPSNALKRPANSHINRKAPAVTGILYYVELLHSDGESTRVNSDRAFHTGDRIRLHLNSNVNGDLVIYQSEDGSKPELLFPSGKLSGRVAKGADVVLPSTHDWFVFDEHPGQIHLTMKLTADRGEGFNQTPPGPSDSDARSIRDLQESQQGSKALKIESDDSPTDPSKVVIVGSRRDPKIPPGQIAVEVTLAHRS